MRYFYRVIDHNGGEHTGSFRFDSDDKEAIQIAKEIASERVRGIMKLRLGIHFEKRRFKQIIVSNYPEGAFNEFDK